jgi:AcrR family transcriptional regulator
MKRTPRETTRALLLATAEEVFLTRGFAATTVEAVAAEAGFTTGAVYSNFEGKAGLFLAVLEQQAAAEAAAVRAALASARTDEQRLEVFTASLGRDPRRWRARMSATLEFLTDAQGKPELLARVRDAQAVADEALGELVAAVCEAVGVDPPAPPAELAQDLLAALNGFVVRSLFDDELDLRSAIARTVNTLLTAERSERMIELIGRETRGGRRR